MAGKTCRAPGCRKSLSDHRASAIYCSDACRARSWKLAKRKASKREWDRASKRQERTNGVIPSDVRVSFSRAVAVLAAWAAIPESEARKVLRPALSERLQSAVER